MLWRVLLEILTATTIATSIFLLYAKHSDRRVTLAFQQALEQIHEHSEATPAKSHVTFHDIKQEEAE